MIGDASRRVLCASAIACSFAAAVAQDDAPLLRVLRRIPLASDTPEGVGIRSDGGQLAVSLRRGVVQVREVSSFALVTEFSRGSEPTARVLTFFGADGRWLALDTKGERVVEVASGAPVAMDAGMLEEFVAARREWLSGSRLQAADPSGRALLARLERAAIADRLDTAHTADGSASVRIKGAPPAPGSFPGDEQGPLLPERRMPTAVLSRRDERFQLVDVAGEPERMAFTADGRFLCLVQRTRIAFEPVDGGEGWELPPPGLRAEPMPVAAGVAGPELWICDDAGPALWNVALRCELRRPALRARDGLSWNSVTHLAPSPDDRWLAAAASGALYVADLTTGRVEIIERKLPGFAVRWCQPPGSVSWSRDSALLVIVDPFALSALDGDVVPGSLTVFRAGAWTESIRENPGSGVLSIDHLPDSHRAILADGFGVALLDLEQPEPIASRTMDAQGVLALGADRMLVAGREGISLCRVPELSVLESETFGPGSIRSIAVSPDRRRIAVAIPGEVVVFELGDG